MKGSRTAGMVPGFVAVLMALAISACSSSSNSPTGPVENGAPQILGDEVRPASKEVTAGVDTTVTITVEATDDSTPGETNSESLTFLWTHESGPAVPLQNANTFRVSFEVPQPEDLSATDTVRLRVSISDGENITTRDYDITIIKPDGNGTQPGTLAVDAGADQSVNSEDEVTLSASIEPADASVSYAWTQTGGPTVSLSAPSASQTSFTAPAPSSSDPNAVQTLEFEVTADDGNGTTDTDSVTVTVLPLPLAARPASVYVAQNGKDVTGKIVRMTEISRGSQQLTGSFNFNSIENEGLALDILGNAIHIGDDSRDADNDVSGGISYLCRMAQRASSNAFSENLDRNLLGDTDTNNDGDLDNHTTLSRDPGAKGVALLHAAGYAVVADFRAQQLKVFGLATTGNIGPAFNPVTLGAKPWDVAYDAGRDIMYVAATNGTVRILDAYLASYQAGQQPTETRTLRLVDSSGAVVGINLHGIAYEPVGDRLVITDVGATDVNGAANFASDGKLYVLGNAADLSGDVQPVTITDASLGNPVDVAIWGRDVLIAEKANEQILLYKDVFTSTGGSVAPDASFPLIAPESLAIEFELDLPANGSDQMPLAAGETSAIDRIVLLMDDGSAPRLHRLSATLGDQIDPPTFSLDTGLANAGALAVDVRGDAFIASSSSSNFGSESALNVVNRLASTRMLGTLTDPATTSAARDRATSYTGFGLIPPDIDEPVAADLAQAAGLLFIADSNGAIHVISTCGEGEVLASVQLDDGVATTTDVATDIDFDEATGNLYVSLGGSKIAVFSEFDEKYTRYAASDDLKGNYVKLEILKDGQVEAAATNLQAIDYVPGAGVDTLILSDKGDANDDTLDGKLLLVKGASTLGSSKLVDVIIDGSTSELAEPVDIGFDGKDLLVLDTRTGSMKLSRYADILSATGDTLLPSNETPLDGYTGTPKAFALVPQQSSSTPAELLRGR